MKGDDRVIAVLNEQLRNELTAIDQYFLHARMYRHERFTKLGEHEYKESIEEMKHADRLIERILMIEGAPNMQDLGRIAVGRSVPERLANDLALEIGSHAKLKEGIALCESLGDYVSREILVAIQTDTEEHIEWLETELQVIEQVGLQNYLQSALGDLAD
ncbi:MAG: bacterioferritin [Burkholderiaceae bacterium]